MTGDAANLQTYALHFESLHGPHLLFIPSRMLLQRETMCFWDRGAGDLMCHVPIAAGILVPEVSRVVRTP